MLTASTALPHDIFVKSLIKAYIRLFNHSLTCSLIHPFNQPSIPPCIYPSNRASTHPSIHPYGHACMHSIISSFHAYIHTFRNQKPWHSFTHLLNHLCTLLSFFLPSLPFLPSRCQLHILLCSASKSNIPDSTCLIAIYLKKAQARASCQ